MLIVEYQRLESRVAGAAAACEFLVNHLQLFLRTGWVVSTSLPGYNYCCVSSDFELAHLTFL